MAIGAPCGSQNVRLAAGERLRVLAICLAGVQPSGDALESILCSAPVVELVCERLPCANTAASLLPALCKRLRPNLLVLCAGDGLRDSEALLEAAKKCNLDLPIIAILETASPDRLRWLVEKGVVDFCLTPLRAEDLVPRLIRWAVADSTARDPARQLGNSLGLQQLIGLSSSFVEAIGSIPKLARCDASVLILGETGTGKEMCARTIHQLGPRAGHPFVPVNCGAIPSELVENELFGHEAGAFTGASSAAHGLVHEANGGTLFLDEIDSLPPQTQVKFLRLLQEKEYRPVGARKTSHADIRIIAASNTNLEEIVRSGQFRADLFYRLNVLPLKLPALRDRREDIPLLARHFLAKYARELSAPGKELSRAAMEKLLAYDWPGNIRELENTLERALVLSDHPTILHTDIRLPGPEPHAPSQDASFKTLKAQAIAQFETEYVQHLLDMHQGNISRASRAAGKNRRAFWELMRKHSIVASSPSPSPAS